MIDVLVAGSMAAAFAAGMVAFFAPCCAGVMMPAYLAAVGGGHRFRVARLTAVYVAGVSLVVLIVSHDERLRSIADRVLWLEDGRFKELAALARDPVCGMLVEPDRAVRLDRAGKTFYFCARGCREQFEREGGTPTGTPMGYIGVERSSR